MSQNPCSKPEPALSSDSFELEARERSVPRWGWMPWIWPDRVLALTMDEIRAARAGKFKFIQVGANDSLKLSTR